MQRILCALTVLTPSLLLAAERGGDAGKELKALEGKWKTVAVEAMGKPFPADALPDFTMVIGAGGKSTGKFGKEEFAFIITVDPSKTPKTIENFHESGKEKGKKQFGIYKLEGDKFTVCMSKAEKERPKDFSTKDTLNVLFVFERVK